MASPGYLSPVEECDPVPISRSSNLYPDEKHVWEAKNQKNCVAVTAGWSRSYRAVNPCAMIQALTAMFFVNRCHHKPETRSDGNLTLLTPLCELDHPIPQHQDGWLADVGTSSSVSVYPVAGNKGLWMLALASIFWEPGSHQVIVGNGACINCLLYHCGPLECAFIILL